MPFESLKELMSAPFREGSWQRIHDRRRRKRELRRLAALPRYLPTTTDLLGTPLEVVDAASFLWTYSAVFETQLYHFRSDRPRPLIIDGGANIGLSICFFKRLYPDCRIVGFEPDPQLFEVLRRNAERLQVADVDLVRSALWVSDGELPFTPDGADGGRLSRAVDEPRMTVPAVRLRSYLDQEIDFLKLDIEGAETDVLLDCSDALQRVRNLYVEYHSFVNEPQRLPELLEVIRGAGFRLHVQGCTASARPFLEARDHEGMDLQLHICGFRPGAPRPAPMTAGSPVPRVPTRGTSTWF
jgi:FkbM family methyltransferase